MTPEYAAPDPSGDEGFRRPRTPIQPVPNRPRLAQDPQH
jgi:hypothetical protein